MEYLKEIREEPGCCVAFGRFDGMHKGHKELIKTLVQTAKEKNVTSVLICIDLDQKATLLTTQEEKAFFAEQLGVDLFISLQSEKMSEEAFFKSVIVNQLKPSTLVIGECHISDSLTKAAVGSNVQIIPCENVCENQSLVTTEVLHEAFQQSDFERMHKLCGHPYMMIGVVEHGKALGRTVGMPTANLGVKENKLRPPSGVYATITTVNGKRLKGLTNIGKRPSVDDDERITIETFLLDFSGDLYDQKLILETHFFIRGVVKFNNLQEVQDQVQKDLEQTKKMLDKITD